MKTVHSTDLQQVCACCRFLSDYPMKSKDDEPDILVIPVILTGQDWLC